MVDTGEEREGGGVVILGGQFGIMLGMLGGFGPGVDELIMTILLAAFTKFEHSVKNDCYLCFISNSNFILHHSLY